MAEVWLQGWGSLDPSPKNISTNTIRTIMIVLVHNNKLKIFETTLRSQQRSSPMKLTVIRQYRIFILCFSEKYAFS